MNDKALILAETRRKAEMELMEAQKKVSRYLLLGMGWVIVFTFIFAYFLFTTLFPQSFSFVIIVSFVFPCIIFFLARRDLKKQYCSYLEEMLKTLEKEPQTASDYANRAGTFYDYKFYEAAVDDYRAALKMEPNDDLTWYDLAETLWRNLRRGDEALPIVEKLGKAEGDYQASALVFQGEILAETDPIAALQCFDKAIELEPDDDDHHIARLRFYLDQNRLDEAVEAVEETAKILKRGGYNRRAEFYELRGTLALKQGRFTDGVKEFSKAIRLAPSEAKYYRLRSDAHAALGNHDKANTDRQKAAMTEHHGSRERSGAE